MSPPSRHPHGPLKETEMTTQGPKVAIITGSSRGIGASIAKRLAANGITVIVNYAGRPGGRCRSGGHGHHSAEEKVAIIELRGGTHLLLLEVDQLAGEGMAQSLTGQFRQRFSEKFDLIIKGKVRVGLKN